MTEASTEELRTAVAAVARMVSRAGLLEAFGHVSARTDNGGFVITSVAPLLAANPEDVIVVDPSGTAVAGPADSAPLETPMHAAIYASRTDVGAICRGHPPNVVAWGVGTDDLPLMHGLGAIAGAQVSVHDDIELITTADSGAAVAATLGGNDSVILRANGALSVGADPIEAATRLYFLEERARVVLAASASPEADPEIWNRRREHTSPELRRAIAWFTTRFEDKK
jgi:HCOMODA/2-hydroxy-3-carboxy-muconic semialdehyde decarboxylase